MPSTARQLLLCLTLVATGAAANPPRCAPFLAALAAESPRLENLVRLVGPLERRYRDDPYFQHIVKAIRDAKDGETKILQSEDFSVILEFAVKDGRLTVQIGHIGQRGIREGQRPSPSRTLFPKVMAAVWVGLGLRAQEAPSLRSLRVDADLVRNPGLPALLRSLGFRERWGERHVLQGVALATFAALGLVAGPAVAAPGALFGKAVTALAWAGPFGLLWFPHYRHFRLELELPGPTRP